MELTKCVQLEQTTLLYEIFHAEKTTVYM